MWCNGMPAGFCDAPAYGMRLKCTVSRRWDGWEMASDGGYTGYVPALACPRHSGPKVRTFMDGNAWCAVHPDFVNLQESDAGFGATKEEARAALAVQPPKTE